MAQFDRVDLTTYPNHYTKDLETERVVGEWRDAITGSMCETFIMSGAMSDMIGQYIGGVRYNDGNDKIITAVTIQCVNSGSGGVSRVDIRKAAAATAMGTDKSIFSHQEFRPALSASAGDFGVGRSTTFVAASASWARGQQLACVVLAGAGAAGLSAQSNVAVRVWWKPSGSY
jgi:hypothetical protein